jgi:hypothetical protein
VVCAAYQPAIREIDQQWQIRKQPRLTKTQYSPFFVFLVVVTIEQACNSSLLYITHNYLDPHIRSLVISMCGVRCAVCGGK